MITDIRKEAAERVLNACRTLTEKGLVARTWGNVSARLTGESFLITPSGRSYEDMREEDLVEVGIKDLHWEGENKPSSEKGLHAGIYRLRPDCRFIVHTHQANASAVSVIGEDIPLDGTGAWSVKTAGAGDNAEPDCAAVLGPVLPCASYGLSSTKTLAKNVVKKVREYPDSKAVLMRCHGAVLMGEDDKEALLAAEMLEEACGRIYEKKCGEKICRQAGVDFARQTKSGYRIHVRTPYIMEMSRRGKEVMPYLDDLAQIGGTSIRCIRREASPKEIRRALQGRNAVLVKGDGAICTASDRQEAEAVAIVLEKNCQAANLALKKALKPVDPFSARLERMVYVKKYSGLKDKDKNEVESC